MWDISMASGDFSLWSKWQQDFSFSTRNTSVYRRLCGEEPSQMWILTIMISRHRFLITDTHSILFTPLVGKVVICVDFLNTSLYIWTCLESKRTVSRWIYLLLHCYSMAYLCFSNVWKNNWNLIARDFSSWNDLKTPGKSLRFALNMRLQAWWL